MEYRITFEETNVIFSDNTQVVNILSCLPNVLISIYIAL